ncbi:hypothetical protein NS274_12470 [Pseudomonas oryzihabitans]|nr:hypothetical protein NS274_12470 [Pseudomonas psychrotolerans]
MTLTITPKYPASDIIVIIRKAIIKLFYCCKTQALKVVSTNFVAGLVLPGIATKTFIQIGFQRIRSYLHTVKMPSLY